MTGRGRGSTLARKQAVRARSGSSRKPNPFARWLRPGSPTPPCWSPRYTREMREKLDKVVLPDVGKVAIGALGRAEIEGCLLAPIVARGANRRDAARTWCAGFLSTRWTWSRALGVRHHLSVPHRQAVVQAKHPHVHIAVALLRAEVGGLLIGEGEVSHLHDNEAGRAHRPLSPVHIGLAWLQMLTQFGRVGEEDAPGGGVSCAAGAILTEDEHLAIETRLGMAHPIASATSLEPESVCRFGQDRQCISCIHWLEFDWMASTAPFPSAPFGQIALFDL